MQQATRIGVYNMTDVITLIKPVISTDQYGNEESTDNEKTVMCEVSSITQSEFYAAADTELNPEYRFTVFFGDYSGENILEYHDTRYGIYRTFRTGDYMELYAERKIGV